MELFGGEGDSLHASTPTCRSLSSTVSTQVRSDAGLLHGTPRLVLLPPGGGRLYHPHQSYASVVLFAGFSNFEGREQCM